MEPAVAEIIKLVLQMSFSVMEQAGLSELEQKALYEKERQRFLGNISEELPDVPA